MASFIHKKLSPKSSNQQQGLRNFVHNHSWTQTRGTKIKEKDYDFWWNCKENGRKKPRKQHHPIFLLSSINQSIDQNLLFTYQDTKLSHVTMSINPFFSFFFFPSVFASSIIFLVKIKFKTNKKLNLKIKHFKNKKTIQLLKCSLLSCFTSRRAMHRISVLLL